MPYIRFWEMFSYTCSASLHACAPLPEIVKAKNRPRSPYYPRYALLSPIHVIPNLREIAFGSAEAGPHAVLRGAPSLDSWGPLAQNDKQNKKGFAAANPFKSHLSLES